LAQSEKLTALFSWIAPGLEDFPARGSTWCSADAPVSKRLIKLPLGKAMQWKQNPASPCPEQQVPQPLVYLSKHTIGQW